MDTTQEPTGNKALMKTIRQADNRQFIENSTLINNSHTRHSLPRSFGWCQRLLLAGIGLLGFCMTPKAQTISLRGQWQVKLDSNAFNYNLQLPGTLDDAGIGHKVTHKPQMNIATMAHLARRVSYTGKAWYTRTVAIPASWNNKHITLTLGRVLWQSQVSIDGVPVSTQEESLVTSHQYDLTGKLIPGRTHVLTIMVDNGNIHPGINIYERKYPNADSYEMAHSYTNHTQIKWNGILGDLSLQARPTTYLQQVVVTPTVSTHQLHIQYQVQQAHGSAATIRSYVIDAKTKRRWKEQASTTAGNITTTGNNATASGYVSGNPAVTNKNSASGTLVNATIPFDANVQYWDEFTPQQYQLVSILQSAHGSDTVVTTFGIRDLQTDNNNLSLNGHRLFMRGNLECIIFPLKGYPPMDKTAWLKLFVQARSFGLNSFRFHSWCPPQAAFEAADETGFYLQVELPHWNLKVGADTASFGFLRREAFRILAQYGNHPSFLFFSMGNELEGDFKQLNELVHDLKATDARHLYATTSFTFQKGITGAPQPEDDYFVTQWTNDGWVRGQGVFNDQSPDFTKDYTATSAKISLPLISHEIGQYSVYPDLTEITKYTGNLVPDNLVAIKNDLEQKGRLSLAPAYLQASGKLATLLYKEEIERALKTKTFDGFQLLQLQDFPGQGTALVGVLNAFWQPKGFVNAQQFHRFNSEVTPLIRYPKAIYHNNERFTATVELANFFKPLNKAVLYWTIRTAKGTVVGSGLFDPKDYPVDNGLSVGTIDLSLENLTTATQLIIEVGVKGTTYNNQWNVWVYPAAPASTLPDNIVVTDAYATAVAALERGQKVLLSPPTNALQGITGRFVPVFWSPVHFPDQPGTMGQLIKATHPALQQFPTATHTDWQWWDLVKKSKSLKMDSLADKAIIVRVIDNFVTNSNLTSLFEVKVGKGKLLFSGMDLLTDIANRPAAQQLYNSLISYMKGSSFAPATEVPLSWIEGLFNKP